MGFSGQEYWSGLPFPPPGHLLHPGIKPASPASPTLLGRFFTTALPVKSTPGCHTPVHKKCFDLVMSHPDNCYGASPCLLHSQEDSLRCNIWKTTNSGARLPMESLKLRYSGGRCPLLLITFLSLKGHFFHSLYLRKLDLQLAAPLPLALKALQRSVDPNYLFLRWLLIAALFSSLNIHWGPHGLGWQAFFSYWLKVIMTRSIVLKWLHFRVVTHTTWVIEMCDFSNTSCDNSIKPVMVMLHFISVLYTNCLIKPLVSSKGFDQTSPS